LCHNAVRQNSGGLTMQTTWIGAWRLDLSCVASYGGNCGIDTATIPSEGNQAAAAEAIKDAVLRRLGASGAMRQYLEVRDVRRVNELV
jgi:hypothetical protein